MKRFIYSFLFLISLTGSIFFVKGQEKEIKEDISIAAHSDATSIPLNRTVGFFVTIRWKGDQDKYTIDDFENPVLNAFEIIKTSSSNIVEDVEGVQYSKKIYAYTLKPQELGMGYVDGVFLKYTNNETMKSNTVATNRIGIKITKPIKEADYSSIIYFILVLLLISFGVYFIIFAVKRKRRIEREKLESEEKEIDLEGEYLEIIRKYKPDVSSDLNKLLNEISQLLNKYLSLKYDFELAGMNKDKISERLKEKNVDSILVEKIDNIIEKSDVYRFSGQSINLPEYESIYSSIESVIEKNYRVTRECRE